ncbi:MULTISPECIES: excinuclease ABC subunit UvrA [unclassified Gemella]|uniref:excinuclease ABC subunit UvrA n=1 Tax=unclassified Gemella TaxID=2624949 RepID=UPI001072FE1B|nr:MULTISPECIES: excinuclease ABC subunit UvrA [unclassified Gemella]MBF0710273.1 excinuclease ABC subunit UvrA [Gemella sp. GL1.1]MBF0746299.1 excinuclease ABC subunit UvrA [Gemella sp. 19428wG2_WT2a]NYS27617.1 excinuclease ABC subunit UvrA [Gemella sp. GL1]TFU60575.1 excinuclease ABC subunit UvrA [Gemella sp. WT2a]
MRRNKNIVIKGARENNLKNIDLEIPRDSFVVITGVSGSGKSSLAFDTIYAEGQRRYVESLSAYARQFLGNLEKPDVDSIEGLSPAISINQKTTSRNPRSTVATVTEIYDYLRLLYARIGQVYCPKHKEKIEPSSVSQIVDSIMEMPERSRLQILAPVVKEQKGTHKKVLEKLLKDGYVRFKIDGEIYESDDLPELDKNKKHSISVIVDRIIIKEDIQNRLADSVETALKLADNGMVEVENINENSINLYSTKYSCKYCDYSIGEVEPRIFSFNNPQGACQNCDGLGFRDNVDINKVINFDLSIKEGAINVFSSATSVYYPSLIECVCKTFGIDMNTPFKELSQEDQDIIFNGNREKEVIHKYINMEGLNKTRVNYFEGVRDIVYRRYTSSMSKSTREAMSKYIKEDICKSCKGKRLRPEILSIYVGNENIADIVAKSIRDGYDFFNNIELSEKDAQIADLVLKEIKARLQFLNDVGLDYLTLDRAAGTLSGGEAQRIRLATQIGSKLMGVTYILDEPSIGLHQRDNEKLINTMKSMKELGNTVLVVEHDEDTMRECDYIVDIGPGAGEHGGQVVAKGSLKEIMENKNSLTGQYLSGKMKIELPKERRKGNGSFIEVIKAKQNNLKNVSVKIPLGKLVGVTGVSGSGKSTLVNEILFKSVKNILSKESIDRTVVRDIVGVEGNIDKIIDIDQTPIGRTPRSNPATYIGVFDDIRDLYASTNEAKLRGYKKGRFSFNVKGGRCEACSGDGIIKIEMHFLPDVHVACEQCQGKRYNRETLEVNYKGKNISDVLNMTVKDAYEFFYNVPKIKNKIETLIKVGLDYIRLGQSATTLSGGEAQRVKLASELYKKSTGKTLYILDEPTTGLHIHDISKLIKIIDTLVDSGNSVLVIEHNLDVIKCCDHLIELGPEGGVKGGEIVAECTPEKLTKIKKSYTGQFLKKLLN